MLEIYRSDSYKNGDYTVEMVDESVYNWNVELRSIDKESELYKDLMNLKAKEGIDNITLNMTFNDKYPIEPPFVRIVYPILNCKLSFHGIFSSSILLICLHSDIRLFLDWKWLAIPVTCLYVLSENNPLAPECLSMVTFISFTVISVFWSLNLSFFSSLLRQTCGGRWCNLHRTVIETMLEPGIHNRIGHYTNGGAFGEG